MKNKYLLFIVILVIYVISDYLFNDAILYLVGGAIGAISNINNIKLTDISFKSIWTLLLAVNVALFWWVKNKAGRFFCLLAIAALMYVMDVFVYDIIDSGAEKLYHLRKGIGVLMKSILLFLVVNFTPRCAHTK